MDTLHFERYEYKYFIPEEIVDDVRRFIRPWVELDEHSAAAPDRRYAIQNLYLDTPDLALYRSCRDGGIDRYKLRIRWYGSNLQGPFFFEVKRKIRQVILKDRARVSLAELRAILRGEPDSLPDGPARDNLMSFLDRMGVRGARPFCRLRYTREAYESVFGDYARATFDRAMCYQPARDFALRADPSGWIPIDGARSMEGSRCALCLELKFERTFPAWMSDLVLTFGLERVGYSKYLSAVEHALEFSRGGIDPGRTAFLGG